MRISDWSSDVCSSDLSWGIEAEYSQGFDLGEGNGRLALSGSRQEGKVKSGRYDGLDLAQVPDWLASANLNLRYPVTKDVALTSNVLISGQWGGKQELTATSVDLDDYVLVRSEEHTSELQSLMR